MSKGVKKRFLDPGFLQTFESATSSNDFIYNFLSCLTPERYGEIFGFLLNDDVETFFRSCWEKAPCHFKRNLNERVFFGDLLSRKSFVKIVKGNSLPYEENFKILKYDGNDRVLFDTSGSTYPQKTDIQTMFSDGYTVQFFQPQRYSDGLFYINASFERYFQSLAGASAYLTPRKTQGLAPHYDDVEVFILQTEGSKTWYLWPSPLLLSETHSQSIPRDRLPKGMVSLSITVTNNCIKNQDNMCKW